jgi:DNA-binding XRE family transcriptional regulator
MDDFEILRRAHVLLGQYGFEAEQEQIGKAVRIITATAKRLGVTTGEKARIASGSQGERLKMLRERTGRTRAQLAELCGVNMSTVRAHENGEHNIPDEAARAYAQALGVTLAMILYGAD